MWGKTFGRHKFVKFRISVIILIKTKKQKYVQQLECSGMFKENFKQTCIQCTNKVNNDMLNNRCL